MNIEIKVDEEFLTLLEGIKKGLEELALNKGASIHQEKSEDKPMTLEEFTAPEYTLQEVRAKLATLEAAKAKELINLFGVKKLTDLPKEQYAELMKKAGEA